MNKNIFIKIKFCILGMFFFKNKIFSFSKTFEIFIQEKQQEIKKEKQKKKQIYNELIEHVKKIKQYHAIIDTYDISIQNYNEKVLEKLSNICEILKQKYLFFMKVLDDLLEEIHIISNLSRFCNRLSYKFCLQKEKKNLYYNILKNEKNQIDQIKNKIQDFKKNFESELLIFIPKIKNIKKICSFQIFLEQCKKNFDVTVFQEKQKKIKENLNNYKGEIYQEDNLDVSFIKNQYKKEKKLEEEFCNLEEQQLGFAIEKIQIVDLILDKIQ